MMKARAIEALSALARRFGFTLAPDWLAAERPLADHLARLFERLGVDTVIDVGANEGQYATMLRRMVGYRGRIIAVEPQPRSAAKLRHTFAHDAAWTLHEIALGPKPGRMALNIMQSSDFSSFLEPDVEQTPIFSNANRVVDRIEVAVSTLDELLLDAQRNFGSECVYLKLDTQGFDLQVMEGLIRAAPLVVALQTEMSVVPIYRDMPDYRQSLQAIADRGFVLSNLFPVTVADLRLIEFDGVFVRR